jgi:hypothetical protein
MHFVYLLGSLSFRKPHGFPHVLFLETGEGDGEGVKPDFLDKNQNARKANTRKTITERVLNFIFIYVLLTF